VKDKSIRPREGTGEPDFRVAKVIYSKGLMSLNQTTPRN